MHADVINYVKTCNPCQKIKHNHKNVTGYLHALEIPASPFNTILLDFDTSLPDSSSKDAILVVVSGLTKFVTFIATKTSITALETATLLYKHLVKPFGLPRIIIGDQDPR
jgi:hypothetical protein